MGDETIIYDDPNIKITNKAIITRTISQDIATLSRLELKHKYSYVALLLVSAIALILEAFDFVSRSNWHWAILALPIFAGLMGWLFVNDLKLIGVKASGGVVTLMNGVSRTYGTMILDQFTAARSKAH